MAVDEWLLAQTLSTPVLRVYEWSGEWGTIGYFGSLTAAQQALPGLQWVRRWSGGGTVDHRNDWTYTLVLPQSNPIARWKGGLSYAWIHAALARVLAAEGLASALCPDATESTTPLCFERPVEHDLVMPGGSKLAGAGQRRCREGFLHQGSVAGRCGAAASTQRAMRLASQLATSWQPQAFEPPSADIAALVAHRYANPAWNARR